MISKTHLDQITGLFSAGKINSEIQNELFQLADISDEGTDGDGEEAAFKLRILLEAYEGLPVNTYSNGDGSDGEVFEESTTQFSAEEIEMQVQIDLLTANLEREKDEQADLIVDELQPHLARTRKG